MQSLFSGKYFSQKSFFVCSHVSTRKLNTFLLLSSDVTFRHKAIRWLKKVTALRAQEANTTSPLHHIPETFSIKILFYQKIFLSFSLYYFVEFSALQPSKRVLLVTFMKVSLRFLIKVTSNTRWEVGKTRKAKEQKTTHEERGKKMKTFSDGIIALNKLLFGMGCNMGFLCCERNIPPCGNQALGDL